MSEPLCAVCGKPQSYYVHRERYLGHLFQPPAPPQKKGGSDAD